MATYRNCCCASGENAEARRCLAARADHRLRHKLSVGPEDLDALIAAIRDIHHAVVRYLDAVDETELLLRFLFERLVSKSAPQPFEGTGLRIQNNHSLIAISIRNEQLAAIKVRIRRLVEILRVRVARALIPMADLKRNFPAVVNFRSMSSESPGGNGVPYPLFPPIQTLPFGST